MQKRRPNSNEYAAYYETYIGKVNGNDFLAEIKKMKSQTIDLLSQLSTEQWNHKYAPEKWTVKEVMIHIMDTERIFAYRALRVSRNDKTPLPGFEQNDYVPFYHAEQRSASSIIAEYEAVRNSTIQLFENFREEDLNRIGEASGHPISTLSLGFMIAGHEIHHIEILKERYFS